MARYAAQAAAIGLEFKFAQAFRTSHDFEEIGAKRHV